MPPADRTGSIPASCNHASNPAGAGDWGSRSPRWPATWGSMRALLVARHRVTVRRVNALDNGAGAGRGVGRDPPDQARLGQLAEEQAALRRVATLVARRLRRRRCSPRSPRRSGSCFGSSWRPWSGTRPTVRRSPSRPGARQAKTSPLASGGPLRGTTSARSCSRPAARPGSTAMPIVPRARSVPTERRASARRLGRRSSSREPVGVIFTGSTLEQPLPPDTEARLASFTELVATAIANTESRASSPGWLRSRQRCGGWPRWWREACRPSRFSRPSATRSAACSGRRRESSGSSTTARQSSSPASRRPSSSPVGTRWEFQPGMASAEVYRTRCSARVDAMDWWSASGPVAGAARGMGNRLECREPDRCRGPSVGRDDRCVHRRASAVRSGGTPGEVQAPP